jgi:PAS domain S-box-containing protein/putative nucleotidyltransferase with HDIG domain
MKNSELNTPVKEVIANKAKILVVEDEWSIATAIQTSLENSGYNVSGIASSGEEAITQVEVDKPDLALMDIVLPGSIDGIETARRLRDGWNIPVIFLTGMSDESVLKRAKDTDPLGYMLKPYKETDLMTMIEIALHQYHITQDREKEAVRESEARFRTIYEKSAVGISLLDTDGKVVQANAALQAMLGYDEDEIHGMHFSEFTYADDIEEDQRLFSELVTGKREYYQLDKRYINRAGKVIWAKLAASLIRDKEDKPSYAIRMVEDISDQKRIEEALGRSEERYRMLVELSPDGVFIHRNDRIEFINSAGLRLLGAERSEQIVGKSLFEIIHPDYHEAIKGRIKDILKRGKTAPFMFERVLTLDGKEVPVEVTASPFSDRSGPAVQVILHDISSRIQAEEKINRTTQRSEELAEVSKILAEVSTDYKALIEMVVRKATELVGDTAFVTLLTDDGQTLVPAAVYNKSLDATSFARELLEATSLRMGDGMAGQVMQSGEPVLIPSMTNEEAENIFSPDFKPFIERYGAYGLLIVPLRSQRRVLGTLSVMRNRPDLPYDEEDQTFLQDLADRAALAIAMARLFDQTNRRLRNVQALRTIDTAITGSLDLGLTLSVILEQVTTQQNVDAADILLLNPHSHLLEFVAGRGFLTGGINHSHLRLGEGYAGRAALERETVFIPDLTSVAKGNVRADLILGEGLVTYCGVPLIAKGVVKGVLETFHRNRLDVGTEWVAFLETLAGQAAIAVDSAQMFTGLQRSNIDLVLAYDATIEGWSKTLDLRDRETENHSQRVTELSDHLARTLGMGEADLVHLRRGALLHDIGKMGIPDEILHKAGSLTEEERKIMEKHPEYAFDLLSPISYLRPAIDIPYCHHEHWDGSGYPRGLKGEQIPLAARIFAVVDNWDALTSNRPYRPAWPRKQVEEHIRSLSGINFDPLIVEAFLRMMK